MLYCADKIIKDKKRGEGKGVQDTTDKEKSINKQVNDVYLIF
jgi:hypothetical protein